MTDKLDIFEILDNVDGGNISYLNNLSDDKKKQYQPIVAMRWQSGTKSVKQLKLLNETYNKNCYTLYKHQDLLYKLSIVASDGKKKPYTWIKRKTNVSKRPVSAKIISEYYKISIKQSTDILKMLTFEDAVELAEFLGYDNDTIKNIKNEFKK